MRGSFNRIGSINHKHKLLSPYRTGNFLDNLSWSRLKVACSTSSAWIKLLTSSAICLLFYSNWSLDDWSSFCSILLAQSGRGNWKWDVQERLDQAINSDVARALINISIGKVDTTFLIYSAIQSTLVNPTYSVPTLGLSDYAGVGITR